MDTKSDFIADCRADGARDFANAGDSGATVDELVAERAEDWARDEIGAEFGLTAQQQGLLVWAQAWVAASGRAVTLDGAPTGWTLTVRRDSGAFCWTCDGPQGDHGGYCRTYAEAAADARMMLASLLAFAN